MSESSEDRVLRKRANAEMAYKQFGPLNRHSLQEDLKPLRERLAVLEARVKELESHLGVTP